MNPTLSFCSARDSIVRYRHTPDRRLMNIAETTNISAVSCRASILPQATMRMAATTSTSRIIKATCAVLSPTTTVLQRPSTIIPGARCLAKAMAITFGQETIFSKEESSKKAMPTPSTTYRTATTTRYCLILSQSTVNQNHIIRSVSTTMPSAIPSVIATPTEMQLEL